MFSSVDYTLRKSFGSRKLMQTTVSGQDRQGRQDFTRVETVNSFYIPAAPFLPSPGLREELTVPNIQLASASATASGVPEHLREKVLSHIDQAEEALSKAAQAYDAAINSAGFAMQGHQSQAYGMTAVLPIGFRVLGPMLDSRGARAGAKKMQEVEDRLRAVGQILAWIEKELDGKATMPAPKEPLAMTALLQLYNSKDAKLASASHPVLLAICQTQMGGGTGAMQQQGRGMVRGGGLRGRRHARRMGYRTYPGGFSRPTLHGLVGGMLGGVSRGQMADKASTRLAAEDVCSADLVEFQRLTRQLEAVRQWLMF